MKNSRIHSILLAFLGILCSFHLVGQSIPVGTPILEDVIRRNQLLGILDHSFSLTARPFFPVVEEKFAYINVLPLTWKQQYNSDHPEGMNDGAMIPSRGYQSLVTGGFFAKFGILSIQLQPELVFAENKSFQGFPDENSDKLWREYSKIVNEIDLPERFGEETYKKAFWGQSSIRLTYKSLSLGLSNENLWWGPGMKNSLLMTNNAPGFKHLTFNTVRPVHTVIGSFEGQLVAGRLDASGYPGLDSSRLAQHNVTYMTKPIGWRYFNGLVLSYQPRWLPGLFLGATRSFITYHQDLSNNLNLYLPVIIPMLKETIGNNLEDVIRRDQIASIFARWLAPESHMEFYLEYGREDYNYDLTDFILEPDHFRAYIIGFRKLTPINKRKNEFLDVQAELSQFNTNQGSNRAKGVSYGWYQHGVVRDGYTHNGQILGSAIGAGSSMQSVSLSWVKNYNRIGFDFKRVAHNENFWSVAINDYRQHWVDMGGAFIGEWKYKNFLFNSRIEAVGSHNYQWLYAPIPSDTPQWWDHGPIRYNIHAELGITYLFNQL